MRAFIERHRGGLNINLLIAKLGFEEKGYLNEYCELVDIPQGGITRSAFAQIRFIAVAMPEA